MDQFELTHTFTFEAAHHLPCAGQHHPCRQLHGHSYRVEVTVVGAVDAAGWVIDFDHIAAVAAPIVGELDHRLLNEIVGLDNPTSEHLAAWLWARLCTDLPQLFEIAVSETPATCCRYRGPTR